MFCGSAQDLSPGTGQSGDPPPGKYVWPVWGTMTASETSGQGKCHLELNFG